MAESEIKRHIAQLFSGPVVEKQQASRLRCYGTVLSHVYKGMKHQVIVLEEGFKYQDEHYTRLTTIAKLITGTTTWTGLRFVGLGAQLSNKSTEFSESCYVSA